MRREMEEEKGKIAFFFKENENEPRCVLLKSWSRVAQVGFFNPLLCFFQLLCYTFLTLGHQNCPKNILNLCIQSEPIAVRADSTVHICLLFCQIRILSMYKSQTYTVGSFKARFSD